jgi:MFS transporter, MHS family, shikimate and dehydroshikimate transport protein
MGGNAVTKMTAWPGARVTAAAVGAPHRSEYVQVALASAIGTTVEYYDFTLYATATALVFNKLFFPSNDPLLGSLAAFATFFVGYCARPVGGILFGHFGDRIGRRTMLLLTVLIMGLGTFLIGLMPTYAEIGVGAPILLLTLRLLQGIGLGGEYGGGMVMAVEHAPERKRGLCSALVHIGVPAGFLIPIALMGGLSAWLPEDRFLAWGWRLPFLASVLLVLLALFIRFRISESPAFQAEAARRAPAAIPAVEAVRNHWKDILLGIGAKIAESGLFNIYAVFAITYAVTVHHLPKTMVLNGILAACLVECLTLPVFGSLSDRWGRKPVYIMGALFQAALAFPFFLLMDTANPAMIWLAVALGLGLGHGAMYGAQGAFFSELFPARVRYSGLSLVQQIGPILGGGLSPLIATALLASYGTPRAVAVYMTGIAVLSAVCAAALRETRPAR